MSSSAPNLILARAISACNYTDVIDLTSDSIAMIRARSVPVQELIFPDEVHDFILYHDWLASYERAADFFESTLHPDR